jgi:outer membrane lipoprotein carrier protein
MKKLIAYSFILMFHLSIYGQTEKILIQDPNAEYLLDKFARIFSSEEAYQIEFKYVVESLAENYKVEDIGSAIVKGQKYKLKTEDGEVYFNGSKMWTYNPINEEVYISIPTAGNLDQLMTVPFILLKNYKEHFKYILKDEIKIGNKIYFEIDMFPIQLESGYSLLRLRVEKESEKLHSVIMHQKNGVHFNIIITEMIPNIKINDNVFTWDSQKNPDVLEIEM